MSKKRVFITHNPYTSRYAARSILHHLHRHDMSVHLVEEDRSFTTPPPNQVYDEWLQSSEILIAIMSPSIFTRPYANDSWWWREIEMAFEHGLSVIVVRSYGFRFPLSPPWNKTHVENLGKCPSIAFSDMDVKASLELLVLHINSCASKPDTMAQVSAKNTRYSELLLEQLNELPIPSPSHLTAEKLVNHATIVAGFGDYAADEEECTQALKHHPTYIAARLNRASSHALQGHYREAFEDVNWCIENDRDNFRHYNNRGNIFTMTGNFDMALLDFSKAIDLNSHSDYQYNNRGFTRYQIGDYSGAFQDCSQAIKINQESVDAYDSRGLAHFCMEEYENALQDFQMVLKTRPQMFESLAGLAITQHALGNVAAAKTAWENLIAIIGVDDLDFLRKRFLWNDVVFDAIKKLVETLGMLP